MGPFYVVPTVLTPATATDLTCLNNVLTDLSLSGRQPEDDIFLRRVIKQTTGIVQNYCNRTFAQQTYQDLIRPERDSRSSYRQTHGGEYIPRNGPLVSVTSVTENYEGTNPVTLVAGADYEVSLATNTIYRLDENGNRTNWQDWPVCIVYVAGYTLPPAANATLPPEIEDAVIRLIKDKWFARDRDSFLKEQDIQGVGREVYWVGNQGSGALSPDIEDVLDNYRILTVG